MRRLTYLFLGLMLAGGLSVLTPATGTEKTYVGSIGDSMCGAKHSMGGSDKDCTLGCIKEGAKYILIGVDGKLYQLSDQKTPEQFAGAKVKVTGTLNGDTITVTSIAAN